MNDEAVQDLARRAGIAVEWEDFAGRPKTVSPEVLRRILAALGVPADSRSDLANSRRILSRRSSLGDLPPLVTGTAGRPTRLDLGANETAPAQLKLERGGTRDLTLVPARGRLRVPAISETGYHRLALDDRELVLAIAPAQCRTVDDVVPDARLWGPAAQVYSLRTRGDAGIGDLAGVAELAASAGRHGADALALSPLHAMFTADPNRYGPYAPSSRLFMNPLHAAPALVFDEERLHRAIADAGQQSNYEQLESRNLIDWPESAHAKLQVLRCLFDSFIAGNGEEALAADFARFRADGGALLEEHTRFEALQADRPDHPDWRRWPLDLRHPSGAAVEAFSHAHRRDVLFHSFLQWLTDRSVAAAQARARQAGMRIGLISDLAVGMDPTGSHAWSRQQDILLGLAIGAPPDLFNPRGQEWGLTGFSPRALVDGGFAPFIATLRACMRHAGGVRIDHAMGLTRLWLVPEGADPADGAYLAYPAHDLLRLLALESVRNGVVVVGEDLGTVPAGFRETLQQTGVHGMRVLWFERDERNGFAPPRTWEPSAVAMTSTHDLPTVAGWWHGTDIEARAAHGRLGEGVTVEQAEAERAAERPALWQALVTDGVAQGPPPPWETPQPVVDAAVRFVARTNSPLCLVPVEDLVGREEQPNLPGTVKEHPNWRQRLPGMAADLLEATPAAERVTALATERPHQ